MTEADAQRYYRSYEEAIHAIGRASRGRGIYVGPGISVKLSALHPRYARAKHERVMQEVLPRLKSLCCSPSGTTSGSTSMRKRPTASSCLWISSRT